MNESCLNQIIWCISSFSTLCTYSYVLIFRLNKLCTVIGIVQIQNIVKLHLHLKFTDEYRKPTTFDGIDQHLYSVTKTIQSHEVKQSPKMQNKTFSWNLRNLSLENCQL